MKIILSRKGFDSGYGGSPSPILPDGRIVSIPIPSNDSSSYGDLSFEKDKTYLDLMKELYSKIKYDNKSFELNENLKCHLDPDIYKNSQKRNKDWVGCFGQIHAAASHLQTQSVEPDDIFLFFGWFRKTIYKDNKLRFDPSDKEGQHVIFGYLQIGEILKIHQSENIPEPFKQHPHCDISRIDNPTNTLYIARPRLSFDETLPGYGTFKYNQDVVLTKEGFTRTQWALPDFFRNVNISYHTNTKLGWRDDYFQSAYKGQEFVVEENPLVENWARNIIKESLVI